MQVQQGHRPRQQHAGPGALINNKHAEAYHDGATEEEVRLKPEAELRPDPVAHLKGGGGRHRWAKGT